MTETHETENEQEPESHGCCGGSEKPKKAEVTQEHKGDKHSCGDHAKKKDEAEKPTGGCCG